LNGTDLSALMGMAQQPQQPQRQQAPQQRPGTQQRAPAAPPAK
jgi:hypothetical protein